MPTSPEAALFFWLPLSLLPVGFALLFSGGKGIRARVGLLLLGGGGGIILFEFAEAWRAPAIWTAMEPWIVHLLLAVIGPSLLMAVGCGLALFGGRSPVGPIPKHWRPMGFATTFLGVAWWLWMLFKSPPLVANIENPFWQGYVSTALISVALLGGFATLFTSIMGDRRGKESAAMAVSALASFAILELLMIDGTDYAAASEWRESILAAIADLGGVLAGIILAVLLFIFVVFVAERNLPLPEEVPRLTEAERSRVREILEEHAGTEGHTSSNLSGASRVEEE